MKQVQSRLSWSRLPLLMSVLVLLILAGCATAPAPTGSLEITITGLPGDQTADIGVNGPDNYGATLTKDTTLSSLTPGSYSVRASIITVTAVEYYVATIAPPSATVVAKKTATVEVTYQRILLPAPGAPADGTGALLAVVIGGLPTGVDADVTVSGPEGFSQDVSTSTVLTVAPGMYTLSFDPVRTDDPIVSKIYNLVDPAPIEVEVTSGMPVSASAMYALRPRSGTLWLAEADDTNVQGLSAEDLSTPVVPSPVMLTIAASATGGVMVDGDGDLWVIEANRAVEYDVNPDTGDAAVSKATVTPLTSPVSGAFDADGNLWIVSANTVVMFSSAQLVDDGGVDGADPVVDGADPEVTIDATGSLDSPAPAGVAFDADGNLWIVSANTVVMFSSAQLVDGASVVPEVTIGANDGSLNAPAGVAFDADGNLWVSNDPADADDVTDTVVKFAQSQLAMSGNPAPDVTISADADNRLNSPKGLAFDNSGDLWVASGDDEGFLVQFKFNGAAVSSSPTAVIAMTGGFSSLAFSPSP